RYLLLLRSLTRARVMKELPSAHTYRMARLDLIPDVLTLPLKETQRIRHQLADLILPRFTGSPEDKQRLVDLFEGEMPLGPLTDCLCFQLPLTLQRKQGLLEEPDVGVRAKTLVMALQSF